MCIGPTSNARLGSKERQGSFEHASNAHTARIARTIWIKRASHNRSAHIERRTHNHHTRVKPIITRASILRRMRSRGSLQTCNEHGAQHQTVNERRGQASNTEPCVKLASNDHRVRIEQTSHTHGYAHRYDIARGAFG